MNSKFFQYIFRHFWFYVAKFFLRLRVEGLENFSGINSKKVIFVANHLGHADGVLAAVSMPWSYHKRIKTIRFMTYYKYIKETFYGPFIKFYGAYPIYPKKGDLEETLAETVDILNIKGHNLMIFPQGKKNRELNIEDVRPGVGHLLKKTNAQIVPIYIEGTYKLKFFETLFFQRKARVVFGKPFFVSDLEKENIDIAKDVFQKVVDLKK